MDIAILISRWMKKRTYEEVKYISPNLTDSAWQNQHQDSGLSDFKACVLVTYVDYVLFSGIIPVSKCETPTVLSELTSYVPLQPYF